MDLAVFAALADVVDEDPAALECVGVQLLLTLKVGSKCGEMRAGINPGVVDDPATRVRARGDPRQRRARPTPDRSSR